MTCPLCNSEKIKIIDSFNKNLLIKLYNKNFWKLLKKTFDEIDILTLKECNDCRIQYFDPMVEGNETYYEMFSNNNYYYSKSKEEFSTVTEYVKTKDKVLDIGCGNGYYGKYLQNSVAVEYVGIDINKNAVNFGQSNNLHILNTHLNDLPERYNDYFDVVGSFQVAEHIVNVKQYFEQSLKRLKKGGIFFIAVPNNESFIKFISNSINNLPPHHLTRWNENTLRFISSKFNVDLIEIRKELLNDVHIKTYVDTIISNSLRQIRNQKFKIVTKRSIFNKLLRYINNKYVYPVILKPIYKTIKIPNFKPIGHTIIGIYRKK
jgi:SAM-dependent methyltransferase